MGKRLIDADKLECHWIIRSDGSRVFACHAEDIENAPTVDAVPVVRCKDCIHADEESCPDGLLWCNAMQQAMFEEEYCSHGERKTDD